MPHESSTSAHPSPEAADRQAATELTTNRASLNSRAYRSAIFWPGMVVGLLVLQLVICGVAIVLASSNGGPVVVKDYHQQALDWDKKQAALRVSERLQWHVVWRLEPEADVYGKRELRIDIVDRDKQPVTGAVISGELFHHAHGNEREALELREVRPGSYTMEVRARWSGLWELQAEVAANDQNYVMADAQTFEFPGRQQVRELPR